jgi:hypothetical protein
VYEINTTAVYLDTLSEISTSLNLDGIVPNEMWTVDTSAAPIQRCLHTIQVPSLSTTRRGVFFVELIGNGVSSRAVIRKGFLRYVERLSVAGHVLRVVDESDAAVDHTRVSFRLGGHRFAPVDASGDILVPFSSGSFPNVPVVLTVDEVETGEAGVGAGAAAWSFSSLATFSHLPEDYHLSIKVFVNRYVVVRTSGGRGWRCGVIECVS